MQRMFFSLVFVFLLTSSVFASTAHIVKKGDTLQKISKKYTVSVASIIEANNMKTNKLSIGMKLVIPGDKTVHSQVKGKTTGEVNLASNDTNDTTPRHKDSYHRVKKGDTYKSIANKYSIQVNQLKKLNHLKKEKLRPGQQLLVMVKSSDPTTYTVKKGDTISKISRKFKVGIAELKDINDLRGNSLKPGQKLLLARKPEAAEPEEGEKAIQVSYDRKLTPVIASARLEEVKNMSTSEDILTELTMKERLILFAKKMLHLPYKFGGNGSFGIDCSAYVQKVYSLVGQVLPRSAREQFHLGEKVNRDELLTGDLVFFRTYASFPSHVGIYLGNNLFIHASSLSKKITIDSLNSPYYMKHYIGAKRLLPNEELDLDLNPDKEEPSKTEN